MENFGNEIKVQQGEDWTLDLLLSASAKEYVPYLVSSQRNNPYFVITIASTKYEKNHRYVKSWWNNIEDSTDPLPLFYDTRPIFYANLTWPEQVPTTPVGDTKIVDDMTGSPKKRYMYRYTLEYSYAEVDETTDGIFYIKNGTSAVKKILPEQYDAAATYYKKDDFDKNLGHKPYYYFYFDYPTTPGSPAVLKQDYECHIRQRFDSDTTSEWGSQNYLYQITLVSGDTMEDRLEEIYDTYTPTNWPDNTEAQYYFVKANYPNELQPDIDADSPLGRIEEVAVILPPTHIEVYNNLRRLI